MTIRLQREETNIIAVTPDELSTLETFYYLFIFEHTQVNKTYAIQLIPTNPSSNRYKSFELDLGNGLVSPDGLDIPSGKGKYYIYQALNDTTLDPEGLVELENGKFVVAPVVRQDIKVRANDTRDIKLKAS